MSSISSKFPTSFIFFLFSFDISLSLLSSSPSISNASILLTFYLGTTTSWGPSRNPYTSLPSSSRFASVGTILLLIVLLSDIIWPNYSHPSIVRSSLSESLFTVVTGIEGGKVEGGGVAEEETEAIVEGNEDDDEDEVKRACNGAGNFFEAFNVDG